MDIKKIMKKYFTNDDYYTILPILEQEAQYNLLVSARTTGKSYQVKHYILLDALLNDRYFVYVRRYGVETKVEMLNSYWEDIDIVLINKICGTDYHCIQCIAGVYYIGKFNERGVFQRMKRIGKAIVLATAGHIKSNVFKNYYNYLYEEVITGQGYLVDEPRLLMDSISTVFRDVIGTVFLLGNLIYPEFIYVEAWGLHNFWKLKTTEIQIYHYEDVKIAVELCDNTASRRNKKSMFFGAAKKNIVEGEFATQKQKMLPFPRKKAELIYIMTLRHQENLMYRLEVLEYEEQLCLYVHPCDDAHTDRVVTKEWEYTPLQTRYLTPVTNGDKLVLYLIANDRIFFSDNLTGTVFRKIIKEYRA